MVLATLKQTDPLVKNFMFHLGLGKVFAFVSKLMNAKSSFEIEAGGVICGVRGTEFSVGVDPDTKRVDLNVYQGTVAASAGGSTHFFTGGQQGLFQNGHWDGKVGTAPPLPVNPPKTFNSNANSNNAGGNAAGGTTNSTGGTNGSASGSNSGAPSETLSYVSQPANQAAAPTGALGDLDSQFQTGILINGENNLNQALQSVNVHLVVPSGEAVP
jgi:hypothetical protein